MAKSKKLRNDLLVRHSPNVEAYVSLLNKKGDRTEMKVQAPSEYFKILRTPNHWKTIYKDSRVRLKTCIASAGSDYVIEGQKVFELVFSNNQRIRIEKGDLTERRIRKVNSALNKELSEIINNGNC